MRGRTRLGRDLVDTDHGGGHLLRAGRSLPDAIGDRLGRRALLLHAGGNVGENLLHPSNGGDDAVDGADGSFDLVANGRDLVGDVFGRTGGLGCQALHLSGHDGEPLARLPGARGLDGRVEGQEVRLPGDLLDHPDDGIDVLGRGGELAHRLLGALRLRRRRLDDIGRLPHPRADVADRVGELAGGTGNSLLVGGGLLRGRRHRRRLSRSFLRRRGELLAALTHAGGSPGQRLQHLRNLTLEAGDQPLNADHAPGLVLAAPFCGRLQAPPLLRVLPEDGERPGHGADVVAAILIGNDLIELPVRKPARRLGDPAHRPRDRPAEPPGDQHGDARGNGSHEQRLAPHRGGWRQNLLHRGFDDKAPGGRRLRKHGRHGNEDGILAVPVLPQQRAPFDASGGHERSGGLLHLQRGVGVGDPLPFFRNEPNMAHAGAPQANDQFTDTVQGQVDAGNARERSVGRVQGYHGARHQPLDAAGGLGIGLDHRRPIGRARSGVIGRRRFVEVHEAVDVRQRVVLVVRVEPGAAVRIPIGLARELGVAAVERVRLPHGIGAEIARMLAHEVLDDPAVRIPVDGAGALHRLEADRQCLGLAERDLDLLPDHCRPLPRRCLQTVERAPFGIVGAQVAEQRDQRRQAQAAQQRRQQHQALAQGQAPKRMFHLKPSP